MKVYLASSYSDRARMCIVRDMILAPLGITVTSRWIDGGHELGIGDALNREFALDDFTDLAAAETCVFFSDVAPKRGRGGKHVEFGIALGREIPIVVVGPKLNVFHWLHGVTHLPNLEELARYFARIVYPVTADGR